MDEPERYEPEAIEAKWQAIWAAEGSFSVPNPDPTAVGGAPSTYVLEMLPYPVRRSTWGTSSTTRSATSSRTSSGAGYTVLRPMGYDAFGLPAENAAIKDGEPPARERTATSTRCGAR